MQNVFWRWRVARGRRDQHKYSSGGGGRYANECEREGECRCTGRNKRGPYCGDRRGGTPAAEARWKQSCLRPVPEFCRCCAGYQRGSRHNRWKGESENRGGHTGRKSFAPERKRITGYTRLRQGRPAGEHQHMDANASHLGGEKAFGKTERLSQLQARSQ